MFAALMLAALLNPASLVDTFVGTSGTVVGGPIDDFPGADFPFGMLQWSPDTTSKNAGGGYEYTDKAITGFSMTHLSGPGCSVFGDFSMLPTVGAVTDPANASQPFTHTSEVSAPGYYAVTLGNPGIRTELTVTPRTGLGRFTFPRTAQANILFNAASDQAGVSKADVRRAISKVPQRPETSAECRINTASISSRISIARLPPPERCTAQAALRAAPGFASMRQQIPWFA